MSAFSNGGRIQAFQHILLSVRVQTEEKEQPKIYETSETRQKRQTDHLTLGGPCSKHVASLRKGKKKMGDSRLYRLSPVLVFVQVTLDRRNQL